MGRKKEDFNPECGKRLKMWLNEIDMTQGELAEKINYTQQHISTIITGNKKLTVDFAKRVSGIAVKHTRSVGEENGIPFWEGIEKVRPEWLLCLDNCKTDNDRIIDYADKKELLHNSQWHILDNSLRNRGMKIIMRHFTEETPTAITSLSYGKEQKCWYEIQSDDGEIVKRLTVIEFVQLQQKLQDYSDFLIFGILK